MAQIDDVRKSFVTDPAASAVKVPADARATAYEDPGGISTPADRVEVMLAGHAIVINPREDAVRRVLGTAYLLGGFELVNELDRAVAEEMKNASRTLESLQTGKDQLLAERERLTSYTSAIDRGIRDTLAQTPLAERRLRNAREVRRFLLEGWSRIAAAEEQVLREYEPWLVAQFVDLAKEAKALALREWARYEPYDRTTDDAVPLGMAEIKKRDPDDLRLRNEAEALVADIRKLHESWADYLREVESIGMLTGLGARKLRLLNPGEDPQARVDNARLNRAAKFKAFEDLRATIGEKFPVALQIYGRIGTLSTDAILTRDETIQRWVVEALVEAAESAQRLADDAPKQALFKPGVRLRVERGETKSDAASNLPGDQQDVLARGLAVPASRIIANRLVDADDEAKTAWAHLAARSKLFKRATDGEEALALYATPGHLHHAALSEVHNALQEVRRKRTEKLDQALLVIDAIALPAGFFTGGATVAMAGVVHAIVRGNEMYITVREYQSRDELARIALVPMQQAIWDHPSSVVLAGKLLEGGFEIATDLVNGGVAGAILDAVQVSLTIGYGAQAVATWLDKDDLLEAT